MNAAKSPLIFINDGDEIPQSLYSGAVLSFIHGDSAGLLSILKSLEKSAPKVALIIEPDTLPFAHWEAHWEDTL